MARSRECAAGVVPWIVVAMIVSSEAQSSTPDKQMMCAGAGVPGSPGRNGYPGRDGRDGSKGDMGNKGEKAERGVRGEKGISGEMGMTGMKGEPGVSGPVGTKGTGGKIGPRGPIGTSGRKGEKGETGERGKKGNTFELNWKQCVWTHYDTKDSGMIQTCRFTKLGSNTALRVVYSGVQVVQSSGVCCSRWYFSFNGSECTTPANIELIVHNSYTTAYRTRQMDGYCENLPSGGVEIALKVGSCHRWRRNTYNAYTGWQTGSPSRIIITEVSSPQK